MSQDIPWHLIKRSFQKNITSGEKDQLADWLAADKDHPAIFSEIKKVYDVIGEMPSSLSPDRENAWRKIKQRISTKNFHKQIPFRYWWYAVASVVLLLVGMGIGWGVWTPETKGSPQFTQVEAPPGQKSRVLLPDGSTVWLNSESTLKYQATFNAKERKVILDGEAYFEVQKDPSRRFRVETGLLNVDVYGTAFNVKSYDDDDNQEITVSEGTVGISSRDREIRRLGKDEQARLDKSTRKISFTSCNPELVTSWKNNELIFDNTSLEEVLKYLERWYGVNITVDPSMLGKHHYTFKIKTESFTEMLEKIKLITPIDYDIDGKEVKIRYMN